MCIAEKYENEAGKFWDIFYKRNGTKFFKDRHYLDREFPQLIGGACSILEVVDAMKQWSKGLILCR